MNAARVSLVTLLLVPSVPLASFAQRGGGGGGNPNTPPDPLRFEYVGPPGNGRAAAVVGVPGDTMTYYLGAASGGVWKSTDGFRTWEPIFDDQPVQAIGSLAVARSNPNIVWAGTGEGWVIRDADVMGDGIYKSTDAGRTWKNMGLVETGRIGRIVIHPTNPDIVFACALGRVTGPQQERGVFRTTDGGTTWQRVLFVDPNTGCSGLTLNPRDPSIMFAATWDVKMATWAMFSGGPGSGIHVSRNGGTTWSRLTNGLPRSPVGKTDVVISPSDPQRVYALIQTANQGSLWRSDDGGRAWRVVSWDRRLIGRAGYYIRVDVNPMNADEVLVANSTFHRSLDGGQTFTIAGGGCGDCHDIWMDPLNPDHWVVTGDNTHGVTRNHGQSFTSVSLPIGQMYHVAVDRQVPYWVYSNRQDDGTMRGPSTMPIQVPNVPSYGRGVVGGGGRGGRGGGGEGGGRGGAAAPTGWDTFVGGCESGFTIPDPTDPTIVWATCYGNKVTRFDARTGRARSVSPWMMTLDSPPDVLKYRCHWTAPLALDPFDPGTVYYGCQVIFKTSNGGQSWAVISPDLSTKDSSRIAFSGGVVGDNLGQFYGEVVFAIAPSPIQRGLIWAGTNDGKIWYTANGGGEWTDVTKNVTGMPVWGTIRKIEASRFDAATAYIAVDFHMMDNRDPFIYKTTDTGKTWSRISDGLPRGHPLAYVSSFAENPNRKGMLFAGTGNAFYYSLDDGGRWRQFKDGLPAAPVTWIEVPDLFHDVVISTYGRGLYILRDITTLEQSDRIPANADLFVYDPRPGFREDRSGRAEFLYALRSAPADSVKVEILDAGGAVVRSMNVAGRVGLNRAVWDLRYDAPRQIELRTIPPDNPHIWEESRFKGRTTRPIIHWGIQGAMRAGPLAAPGDYNVRLSSGSQSATRPFRVVRDPAIPTSDADIVASTGAQVRIRDDLNATVDMVNHLEMMRKQIEDALEANKGKADAEKALRDLDTRMLNVELQLLSKSDLHSDDKWYVEAYRIYLNLVWLNGEIGTGASDVAGGAEYRPTDAQIQILSELERGLAKARADYQALLQRDIPAFNNATAGKLPRITFE